MKNLMILIMGFFILLAAPTFATADVCGVNDLVSYTVDPPTDNVNIVALNDVDLIDGLSQIWGLSHSRENVSKDAKKSYEIERSSVETDNIYIIEYLPTLTYREMKVNKVIIEKENPPNANLILINHFSLEVEYSRMLFSTYRSNSSLIKNYSTYSFKGYCFGDINELRTNEVS